MCNATSLKQLRKNAKNENDVKTAARAQWLHETKERNKSLALTLNANLCFTVRKIQWIPSSISWARLQKQTTLVFLKKYFSWFDSKAGMWSMTSVWNHGEPERSAGGGVMKKEAGNLHPTQTSRANLTRGHHLRRAHWLCVCFSYIFVFLFYFIILFFYSMYPRL